VTSVVAGCVGLPPPPPRDSPTPVADASTSDASTGDSEGEATGTVPVCGNGVMQPGELCDGEDLQGQTCETLGLDGGSLGCRGCLFDASGCLAPPGMVLVPSGTFTMGSRSSVDEQPVRQVTLPSYWIDETEVTVAAYEECVGSGICDAPPEGTTYNYGVGGRAEHPVNGVNWYDADVYCRWVDGGSGRLPTEAEWENAARGTEAFAYPWGNSAASCSRVVMADVMGVGGCGTGSTAAVGSKLLGVSTYGTLDMAGNVQEWVSDWYDDYDPTDVTDPAGPAEGDYRVLRGGAWDDVEPDDLRSAARNLDDPADHTDTVGFRCARTTLIDMPG
jgi:sulfatase modifying factor 1